MISISWYLSAISDDVSANSGDVINHNSKLTLRSLSLDLWDLNVIYILNQYYRLYYVVQNKPKQWNYTKCKYNYII